MFWVFDILYSYMTSSILSITDPLYPYNLKFIDTPPKHLYYKGTLTKTTFSKCLSIVGSRYASTYGISVLKHVFKTLDKSITIVSGFMTGIDTIAHNLAIDNGINTVAILPCGIDVIHPRSNYLLYEKLLNTNNLILSEYAGSHPPLKWCYIKRNRLIAGLSLATLVVEASLNSGSLITANYSYKYKRPILAIPGSIFSSKSHGCNQLISSYGVGVSSGTEINEIIRENRIFI